MSTALSKAARLKPDIRLAQAVSEFQVDLTDDQKAIFSNGQAQAQQRPPSIKDVMQFTAGLDQRSNMRFRCVGPRFTNFLQGVQQFAALGDIIVGGSQNIIACSVWSLVRLSLSVVVGSSAYFEKLSSLFMEIGCSAPRFQSIAALYPHMKHLQDHLHEYFIEVVRLCHEIVRQSKRSTLGKLATSWTDSGLNSYKSGLDRWATMIRDDVNSATTQSVEDERRENSRFRTSLMKWTGLRSASDNAWQTLRLLDACSTYDHQVTWKQTRKAGTTTSFKGLSEYQAWRASCTSSTLVYTGILGSGKSVLLANMVDDLNLYIESSTTPVAYFFCRHDIQESLKARTVIGSLARQILYSMGFSVSGIGPIVPPSGSWDTDQILHILKGGLPSKSEMCCVVDGLDECTAPERREVARFLDGLRETFKCRTCYSLRSQPNMPMEPLDGHHGNTYIIQIPSDNPEISDFIKSELERCLELGKLNVGDPTIIIDILDVLMQGSQGMFLWAALQIAVICTMQTDEAIRQALMRLPKDLFETFTRIRQMYQEAQADHQKRMLEIIYAAMRPLTMNELMEALCVVPRDTVWSPAKMINDPAAVVQCCGPLITIDEEEETVRFVHFSIKQFLESGTGPGDADTFMNQAQETMGEIVFTYLCYDVFSTQLTKVKKPSNFLHSTPSTVIGSVFGSAGTKRQLALKLLKRGKSTTVDGAVARVIEDHWRTSRPAHQFYFRAYAEAYWRRHMSYITDTKWLLARLQQLFRMGFMSPGGKGALHDESTEDARMREKKLLELLTEDAAIDPMRIHDAARSGDAEVMRLLLQTGKVDVDSRGAMGLTPLAGAARNGHEAVVRLLLATGKVDVDSRDNGDQTPLAGAVWNGHEAVVRLLLATGEVDVDSRDELGWTPLAGAAWRGHEAVVRLLLATDKVDVDSRDNDGLTPLAGAAGNGHEAAVRLLLATGKVDVDSRDNGDQTPLAGAAWRGHEAVVRLLLAMGKIDVDSRDNDGLTPLASAASFGHEEVVRLLLATGKVDVDPKDKNGETALFVAAADGHEEVVRLLLATGKVDVDPKDKNGTTALFVAAADGYEEVVRLLLATGKVDVDPKDKNGETALFVAAADGHEEVVRLLLATGKVDVDLKDKDGKTAMSYAKKERKNKIVQLLSEAKKAGAKFEHNTS